MQETTLGKSVLRVQSSFRDTTTTPRRQWKRLITKAGYTPATSGHGCRYEMSRSDQVLICLMWQNGTLKIIDRKKHIFKLSQGEYISPEKIESIYSRSKFVAQIFIYGESLKSSLVAIVVPEPDVLLVWGRDKNIRGCLRDLCQDPRVKQAIIDDLHLLGKKEGLKSFEQVKDITLYPEAFSMENGLLTPTMKTKRIECRKFFVTQIEEMYRTLD